MNNANNWNYLDKLIYKVEILIKKVIIYIKDNKEMPEPEEMIIAATKHLQEENEMLSDYRIPEKVIIRAGGYHCPKCKEILDNELFDKYKIRFCPECGKKLIKVNKSEKSTKINSVEVNVSELL